jgi:hypothetical protein
MPSAQTGQSGRISACPDTGDTRRLPLYAREAAAGGEARDLLLVGSPGTGKTFMAACIANELIAHGRSVLYLPAPVLFERLANHRTLSASFRPDEDRLEEAEREREAILETGYWWSTTWEPSRFKLIRCPSFADTGPPSRGGVRTVFSTNVDLQTLRQQLRRASLVPSDRALYGVAFHGEDLRLRTARIRRQAAYGLVRRTGILTCVYCAVPTPPPSAVLPVPWSGTESGLHSACSPR